MSLYDQLKEIKKFNLYDKVSGVYYIRNIENGHLYVGSSVNIQKRFKEHERYLRLNKHHFLYLQRAYNKYGDSYFVFGVVEFCAEDELKQKEQTYLDELCPKYNVSLDSVSGMRGRTHTKETKDKIKQTLYSSFDKNWFVKRAKKASSYAQLPEAKAKHKESIHKSMTSERLDRMRETQKELWSSDSYRNKQVLAHKQYSDEIKNKFSVAQKKLWNNPEHREVASISRQGKGRSTHTPEDVLEIRNLHFQDGLSARRISELRDEPYQTIRSILYNNWKWLK